MNNKETGISKSKTFFNKFLSLLFIRSLPRQFQIILDLSVISLSFLLAYLLRFDFSPSEKTINDFIIQLPFVLLVQFLFMIAFRVYSFIWRYVGLREARIFLIMVSLAFFPLMAARLLLPENLQLLRIPISVILIHLLLSFCGLFGLRVLRRMLFEYFQKHQQINGNGGKGSNSSSKENQSKRVFLIGAGQAGVLAAKEIQNHGGIGLDIIGFIDDDPLKIGSSIYGKKVIGNTTQLSDLIKKHKIDHVIITIAQTSRKQILRIVKVCEAIPIKVRIIPGYFDLLEGKVQINRIRDIDIEDLLGRDKIHLDEQIVSGFLKNKRVMITGAGGSIGSELVRQVIKHDPEQVLMVERSEFALYSIHKEICQCAISRKCLPVIADVGDEGRMHSIFAQYQPQIVLHAAAHKHVPMMEFNPAEAIKNNSLATWKLGNLAGQFDVDVFVLISTDKAVNSSSIMGASKRFAELFIQGLNSKYDTKFLAVRFGNVLGSTGSVIPLFREQILNGGPITVTHPEMTRYFMTIPEATELVLQASTMGKGSEIFILDMGEPVKISDLATQMISLSGLIPGEDIHIEYTGIRPGEKLYEELNTQEDQVDKTRHPKIFIGKIKEYPAITVNEIVEKLKTLSQNGYDGELRKYIQVKLPEAKLNLETPSFRS